MHRQAAANVVKGKTNLLAFGLKSELVMLGISGIV